MKLTLPSPYYYSYWLWWWNNKCIKNKKTEIYLHHNYAICKGFMLLWATLYEHLSESFPQHLNKQMNISQIQSHHNVSDWARDS